MTHGTGAEIHTVIHSERYDNGKVGYVRYACGRGSAASPSLPPDEFTRGEANCPRCAEAIANAPTEAQRQRQARRQVIATLDAAVAVLGLVEAMERKRRPWWRLW